MFSLPHSSGDGRAVWVPPPAGSPRPLVRPAFPPVCALPRGTGDSTAPAPGVHRGIFSSVLPSTDDYPPRCSSKTRFITPGACRPHASTPARTDTFGRSQGSTNGRGPFQQLQRRGSRKAPASRRYECRTETRPARTAYGMEITPSRLRSKPVGQYAVDLLGTGERAFLNWWNAAILAERLGQLA